MFELLRRLFGRGNSEQEEVERVLRQVRQMSADLGGDLPLGNLRPVLIPSSILSSGDWFGPHHYFPELPLSLTWAYLRPECTMQYLSNEQAEKLTSEGIDWRSVARSALFEDSRARTWTFRRNPDYESVCAAVILHDDLGASRLLCLDQIQDMIPNGFSLFVPDRNVVFVLADDSPRVIRDQMAQWVHHAYRDSEVPMSLEAYSHTLLKKALIEAGELTV